MACAEISWLTPTVFQHRVCGTSSTPPFHFGHSSLSHSLHSLSSPSPSAQIEEVLDDDIKYELQDDIEYENNPDRSKHGSESLTKVPEPEDPPIPQVPPPAPAALLAAGVPP